MGRIRHHSRFRSIGGLAIAAALLTGLLVLTEELGRKPAHGEADEEPRTTGSAAPSASAPRNVGLPPAPPQPVPAGKSVASAPKTFPQMTLLPPYEADDGLTIRTETARVRLAGLDGPTREAVCLDPQDKLWACGLQARAALYNSLRKEPVTCRAVEANGSPIPLVDCTVGGEDVGRALVMKGFAKPTVERDNVLRNARDEAKRGNLGLWNGGWRIRK